MRSREILDEAADKGVTFLDAADVYPLGGDLTTVGRTEEIVGRCRERLLELLLGRPGLAADSVADRRPGLAELIGELRPGGLELALRRDRLRVVAA